MKTCSILIFAFMITKGVTIVDFQKKSSLSNWAVVDDVVMGGRSNGSFSIDDTGNAVFEGTVSLDNNGGFSSVRYRPKAINLSRFSHVVIRLRGDKKSYQFRMKTSVYDRHSYIYTFQTSGEWEEIKIPINKMKPSFRGMSLDMENYPGEVMEELAFLIGNKKAESFHLEIDKIIVE